MAELVHWICVFFAAEILAAKQQFYYEIIETSVFPD